MLAARRPRDVRRFVMSHPGCLASVGVALIVLGPVLLHRGFMLHYDAVFVPRLPFNSAVMGVDGNPPRAVPNDLIVALVSRVLPGDIVERLLLVGAFMFVGAGVDRWRQPVGVGVVSSVALLWNPWVAERLSIGHLSYVWGYGALVWIVVGALRWRSDQSGGRTTLIVGLCVGAAAGSTPGLLTAMAAVVLLLAPGPHREGGRSLLPLAGLWVGVNAAWWWPALTQRAGMPADPDGLRAFGSTADSSGGFVVSVLGGGGIWHQPSWFAERMSGPLPFVAAAVLVAGVLVVVRCHPQRIGLAMLAALGLFVACAASIPVVSHTLVWALAHIPGSGLLRDGQKFLAWWVVPAGLGVGVGTHRVARRARGSWLAPISLAVATLLPLALLPSFAWGRLGRWQPVEYPHEFAQVVALVDADGARVASLPWQLYRRYDWNHAQVTLDPWARLLSADVLVSDTLPTADREITGERPETERIARALIDSERLNSQLRALRVNYVVIDKTQPGANAPALRVGAVIHDGDRLIVRELSAPTRSAAAPRPWPWGVTISAMTVLVGLGWVARSRR